VQRRTELHLVVKRSREEEEDLSRETSGTGATQQERFPEFGAILTNPQNTIYSLFLESINPSRSTLARKKDIIAPSPQN